MRKVTCKDCHRVYDYDKDDFCPKCGSFNPPSDSGATALERDLLSRFGTADAAREREIGAARAYQGQKSGRARHLCEDPKSHRESDDWKREDWKPGAGASAAWQPRTSQGSRNLLVAILTLGILGIVAVISVISPMITRGEVRVPEPAESMPYEEVPAERKDVRLKISHDFDEAIAVGRLTVELDGVRMLDTEGDARLHQEGYKLVVVESYITGGAEFARDFPFGGVYLELSDGSYINAVDDELLAARLANRSVYAITLPDAVWEDPLVGEFVFYVPEGTREATLCIEETEAKLFGSGSELVAVHAVELELP